jgi:hypothetical protein
MYVMWDVLTDLHIFSARGKETDFERLRSEPILEQLGLAYPGLWLRTLIEGIV